MTVERPTLLPLLLTLNLLLPLVLLVLTTSLRIQAPLSARLAYIGATFVALTLLMMGRHGAATALAYVTLGVTVVAELFRIGPFGMRGYAVVVAMLWFNTAFLAMRHIVHPARARRRRERADTVQR